MKTELISSLLIHTLVITILLILQIIYIPANKYIFSLSFVYMYISMFKNTKIHLFLLFILFAIILDSIHYITLGVSAMIISLYYIWLLLQTYYIRNIQILLSYILFLAVNVVLLITHTLLDLLVDLNFNISILFILTAVLSYPLVYLITMLFHKNHAT